MKNIVAVLLFLFSLNTFAGRSMISIFGYDTGDKSDRSFNFEDGHGGSSNENEKRIAFNYAYAITDIFQLGFQYKSLNKTTGGDVVEFGDKFSSFGIYGILNLANRMNNTPYLYIGYSLTSVDDSDQLYDSDGDGTDDSDYKITSEGKGWDFGLGYRFHIGELMGLDFNYSPSLNLHFLNTDTELKAGGTKVSGKASYTTLEAYFLKLDVFF
jgi:hypothetical protein